MNYEPKQIQPAGCSSRIRPHEIENAAQFRNDSLFWAEEKLDGARYLAHVDGSNVAFTGRRISKKTGQFVDKTGNVPHLCNILTSSKLTDTVLDGEIVPPSGQVNSLTRIMGCTPDNAVSRQEQSGWVRYVVFDVLFHEGHDVRGLPLEERRDILNQIMWEHIGPDPDMDGLITRSKTLRVGKDDLFWRIISQGGEGVVLKHIKSVYGSGWIKVKKVLEDSVIVTGYTPGQGKYAGMIGAVTFGQYYEGALITFGKCSGMDDATRQYITDNQDEIMGKVFDIMYQDRFESGSFREPRFLRWRPDLSLEQIIWSNE